MINNGINILNQGKPVALREMIPERSNRMRKEVPKSLGQVQDLILEKHESLSKRLKQVGSLIIEHPNTVALETTAEIEQL